MTLKKSIRMKKQSRVTRSGRSKKAGRAPWWTDARAIGGAVVCIMAAAVVLAGYQSSDQADTASLHRKAKTTTVGLDSTPTIAMSMAAAATDTSRADIAAIESAPEPRSAGVTITGCLERTDETFRLKDTTGAGAPKARSWKSGFLKKGSASIDVVDASKRLNLRNHVGQRVSLTGTLVDREMHVRSVQRVSASCTNTPKVSA
jgi:hypothetical protein